MSDLFNHYDVFTLRGDQIERVQQALAIAQAQIRRGQTEADDYRLEGALVVAEDALATARAAVADAIEAMQAEKEASGEAARERQAWLPLRAA